MILSNEIIEDIKAKSGLLLEQSKDYSILASQIMECTGRGIGVTTLKRLLGYIKDDRKSNQYTLNTLAIFLGFQSWEDCLDKYNIDSEWLYVDPAIYINDLVIGTGLIVKYLDREIQLRVESYENSKVLRVEKAVNSSLMIGDLLYVCRLKVGEIIEAEKVLRGSLVGNYRTHGEIKSIDFL